MAGDTHQRIARLGRRRTSIVAGLRAVPGALDRARCRSRRRRRSTDGSFIPSEWTLENYSGIFKQAQLVHRRAAQLDRHRADRHASSRSCSPSMAAYAIARLNFPGKTLILAGGAGDRDVPADLDRRPAVQHVAQPRPVRHLAGPDHPVHDVRAAAGDLHAVGVLQGDPVGARAGGADRRRHAVPGVPQGHRAAGRARACSPPRSSSSSSLERLRVRRSR